MQVPSTVQYKIICDWICMSLTLYKRAHQTHWIKYYKNLQFFFEFVIKEGTKSLVA